MTNGAIFDEAVYNYTREFPYLWEEIVIPVTYAAERDVVERILLTAARDHAVTDDVSAQRALTSMQERFAMADATLPPAVYGVSPTTGWNSLSGSSFRIVGCETSKIGCRATFWPVLMQRGSALPQRPTTSSVCRHFVWRSPSTTTCEGITGTERDA